MNPVNTGTQVARGSRWVADRVLLVMVGSCQSRPPFSAKLHDLICPVVLPLRALPQSPATS